MAIKGKLPLLVFLLSFIFFVFASVTLAVEDRRGDEVLNPERPEERLRECQRQCDKRERQEERREECRQECQEEFRREQEERGGGGGGRRREGGEIGNDRDPKQQFRRCKQRCQRETKEQEQQRRCEEQCEREYKEQEESGGGRGRGNRGESDNKRDPKQQLRRCKQECQKETRGQEQEQQRRCEERCEREYRERGRDGEGNPRHEGREEEEEEEEYQGEQEGRNPYVFEQHDFTTKFETEHGRFRVLPKFSDRSELLRGIENYRVEILEAEPRTFVLPKHSDAEEVIFVANGRGAISLIQNDKRESFNLRRGDVLRIRAGTTVHIINKDNNEKLVIVKLLQPVNTPGHFEFFYGVGGEDPESYYRAFSHELLEAALNTKREKIQRIFGQQREGGIVKASEEQIRGLSHHEEGGGGWPFGGGESRGRPFNLFRKRASESNQYGQLYEVDPNDSKDLEELDLGISFANISQGSLITPYYNSRATKIAIVTDGEGRFEMACPHLSSSEHGGGEGRRHGGGGSRRQGRRSSPGYQRVSARLRRGVVYVVPAGHPVITVASQNQNLEIICFDVNARNNEKFLLAGRKNIINQVEAEAKELGFGVPSREVDEVFKNQKEEFFFPGPRQRHEGRADA
ncbi:hypothetical protein U1Q18_020220 [Sarracenia purpurea var. burkii]